jgi:DHA1 family tetracycline resistance protein-like MFS transporter
VLELSRKRALNAVLVVQLLNGLGYGLVFPVAALYGEHAGLPPAAITALIALHPLVRLVSGRAWGYLADTYGRRPVLLAGMALQATGHLVFGVAGGPLGLGLGRALTGLGSGEAVAAMAAVGDLVAPEDRSKVIGMARAASGLGMLGGTLVGGVLGLGGLGWPGIAASIACACSFVQIAVRFDETRPEALETGPVGPMPIPGTALAIAAAATASMALAEAIVPLAVEHVMVPTLTLPAGITAAQLALLLTVGVILAWGLTTAVFDGALSGRIVARIGETRAITLGLVLWAVAFVVTPWVYAHGIVAGGLIVALTAVPVSLAGVGLATWISRTAGPEAQGRATGAAQSAMALGEFVGPAVSGTLYAQSYAWPYWTAAGLLLVAAAVSRSLVAVDDPALRQVVR